MTIKKINPLLKINKIIIKKKLHKNFKQLAHLIIKLLKKKLIKTIVKWLINKIIKAINKILKIFNNLNKIVKFKPKFKILLAIKKINPLLLINKIIIKKNKHKNLTQLTHLIIILLKKKIN